jgi:hypothetical protein
VHRLSAQCSNCNTQSVIGARQNNSQGGCHTD